MLIQGIINPGLLSLLARVRHTNTLVIADRGFPFWPEIETVDLSLTDNVPTVARVLGAVRQNFVIGRVFTTREYFAHNTEATGTALRSALAPVEIIVESHAEFKRRVPLAIGLIRTADTTPYANLILESA